MLTLGRLFDDEGKPCFEAHSDEQELFIELDSSALLKLGDGALDEKLHAALDAKRSQIRAAAQNLLNKQFVQRADDGSVRVIISAIDIV